MFKLIYNTCLKIIIVVIFTGCENNVAEKSVNTLNAIEKEVEFLPDNFYFRRGRLGIDNSTEYIIWMNLNEDDTKVLDIDNAIDRETRMNNKGLVIKKYAIDTINLKKAAQLYLNISNKFKCGHLSIKKERNYIFRI